MRSFLTTRPATCFQLLHVRLPENHTFYLSPTLASYKVHVLLAQYWVHRSSSIRDPWITSEFGTETQQMPSFPFQWSLQRQHLQRKNNWHRSESAFSDPEQIKRCQGSLPFPLPHYSSLSLPLQITLRNFLLWSLFTSLIIQNMSLLETETPWGPGRCLTLCWVPSSSNKAWHKRSM